MKRATQLPLPLLIVFALSAGIAHAQVGGTGTPGRISVRTDPNTIKDSSIQQGSDGGVLIFIAQGIREQLGGSWRGVSDIPQRVFDFPMIALSDGSALAPGGDLSGGISRRAQFFDPSTESWTLTGDMTVPRVLHAAALLQDGRVLVSGGSGGSDWRSAEVFDPNSGTWSSTGSMAIVRAGHTLTTLLDGTVLAVGGRTLPSAPTSRSELYSPATGTWTDVGQMNVARENHTATRLNSGKVLVVGGSLDRRSELYDPESQTWTELDRTVGVHFAEYTATLLKDGRVLVVGGVFAPRTAELFNPETSQWKLVGSTRDDRIAHVAALLCDGTVLVAGGFVDGTSDQLRSAEIFDPATEAWTVTDSMAFGRSLFGGVALLSDDPEKSTVLVGGGMTRQICDPEQGCLPVVTRTSEVYEVSCNQPANAPYTFSVGGSTGRPVSLHRQVRWPAGTREPETSR